MLKVRVGHKGDVYFAIKDNMTKEEPNGYKIVRMFYSKDKVNEYVKDSNRLRSGK